MIVMALIALLSALVLAMCYVFFTTKRDGALAAISKEVEEETAHMVRRGEGLNAAFVESVVQGTPFERALTEYQTSRAAILTHERSTDPWDWTGDDLQDYRKREFQRRVEEANRRSLVPAVATFLLVVGLAASVIVVLYNAVGTCLASPP